MTIKEIKRQAIKAARKVKKEDVEEAIEFYKPTAQEMFEKLGYKMKKEDEYQLITYTKKHENMNILIEFAKDFKNFRILAYTEESYDLP